MFMYVFFLNLMSSTRDVEGSVQSVPRTAPLVESTEVCHSLCPRKNSICLTLQIATINLFFMTYRGK